MLIRDLPRLSLFHQTYLKNYIMFLMVCLSGMQRLYGIAISREKREGAENDAVGAAFRSCWLVKDSMELSFYRSGSGSADPDKRKPWLLQMQHG